jgi:ABC-type molybdate transport system ATPase subunit
VGRPLRGHGGAAPNEVAGHRQLGDVLVAVRPSAILVATQRPQPSSARNTWPAQIAGLTMLADRVRLDLDGQPPTWTSTPCRQAS